MVLELLLVWGLLSGSAAWFWSSYAQLLVFHVFSYPVVGYFYPVLMFGILAIYPLVRLLPEREGGEAREREPLLQRILHGRAPRPALVVALAFSALQAVPHLYPGDTALTGEGRLYGLHMFDARVACEAIARVELEDGRTRKHPIHMDAETRVQCDPLVVRAGALALCRKGSLGGAPIRRLDLSLRSRRASDREMRQVVDIPDFCANPPGYDPFFHNDWIAADPR